MGLFMHLRNLEMVNIKRKVGCRAEFVLIHAVVEVKKQQTILNALNDSRELLVLLAQGKQKRKEERNKRQLSN